MSDKEVIFRSPAERLKAYNEGFEGWIWNTQVEHEWNEFNASIPELAQTAPKLLNSHKDVKRSLLYRYREEVDPGVHGDEAQDTGDCVSMGSRGARDTSRSVEIKLHNDPEIWYKRSATEPTYAMRGHRGAGMDPTRAARFETEYGWLFREPIKDKDGNLIFDLSEYNARIGMNYGGSGLPKAVLELIKEHYGYNVGTSTRPKTLEQCLDLFANGYACHSGQSWGTSSRQSKDGINRKDGAWNHDMATEGYDFSEEFFKEPVFFVAQSWGKWNQPNPIWLANQDVYGPWVTGMIIVAADEWERYFLKSGSIHFYSDVTGFQQRTLPAFNVPGIF